MRNGFSTWEEVEAELPPISEQEKAAGRAEIDAALTGWSLKELRRRAGRTQVQVAETIGVTQKSVSAFESGDISKSGLPTITAYLHAIGATMEVVATLNGQTHHIAGDTTQAAYVS